MEALIMEKEQAARRERFLRENCMKWRQEGLRLKERRLEHGMSLRGVAERLGTSPSRISKLEKGLPVSQAKHLIRSHNLLFDYIELRKKLRGFFFDNGLNWRV